MGISFPIFSNLQGTSLSPCGTLLVLLFLAFNCPWEGPRSCGRAAFVHAFLINSACHQELD
jgi:hypothetical protein